jgi:four helix bundle protein
VRLEKGNPAYEKAYALAVRIVKAFKLLTENKSEFVLSKQLLRSGTSIGANLAEANGAISKADLSAKVSIAYKEAQETKYWLNLLKDTDFLEQKAHESLFRDVDEVAAILFAILKKTRIDKKPKTTNDPC